MEFITIKGGLKLTGEIQISGSKNSVLPILACSLLTDKEIRLSNIPRLVDVKSMATLIKSLGVNLKVKNKNFILNTNKITSTKAHYNLVRQMRASFLVLGPLLAREGYAEVSLPGGCAIGSRPVNFHLYAMKKLGANIDISNGYVIATTKKNGLIGGKINFSQISVGATENAIMAAVLAKGETLINNAACEPEIIDLCNCLVSMGAIIEGIGTNKIFIQGVTNFKSNDHEVIPDRIEACTYIIAAAVTNSKLTIKKLNLEHIKKFLEVMNDMGLNFLAEKNSLLIKRSNQLKAINIKTEVFPGFPTVKLSALICDFLLPSMISNC